MLPCKPHRKAMGIISAPYRSSVPGGAFKRHPQTSPAWCWQGKSTLANRLLGRERVLTGPEPGLTRDAVKDEFRWEGRHIVLIDTAGWAPLASLPTEEPGCGPSSSSNAGPPGGC